MRIHAFFASHAWKLSFSIRRFFMHWFTVFAIIWTFIDFVAFFFGKDQDRPWKFLVWIVIGVSVLIALWMSRPRLTRKVRLKDTDVTIKIVVDDLFRRKGSTVIIPVNTFFKHDDIDDKAILMQYRNLFYSNHIEFDSQLKEQLKDEPYTQGVLQGEQVNSYSPGTVVRLQTTHRRIKAAYLVATAELNEHGRAKPNRSLLQFALHELWNRIAERGRKELLAIPIIGSGRGRINVTRYELIYDIVHSFLQAIKDNKFTEELTIIIHPRAFIQNEYSLDEIEEYLRFVSKFNRIENNKVVGFS
ncbi:macro domain-containing protein [Paenibacillus sp. J2TS4]|uniref:macro domain-containing protein n=1 Tax=Paenibacillus sp. J2TS4 TaxID=2807194 RepID=UPI001AFE5947|nr:macro domain-containing protein [Paenibacillus sp. J2TS4]GIP34248.1 hypothetical protein J2TS4_34580 [Paenibacillus sp. J2TS4]